MGMFQLCEGLINDRIQMSTPEWVLLVGSGQPQNTAIGRMMVNLSYAPNLFRGKPALRRRCMYPVSEGDDANIANGVNIPAMRDQVYALYQSCKADLDILRTLSRQSEAETESVFGEAKPPVVFQPLQLTHFQIQRWYTLGLIISIIYTRMLAALYRPLENDDDSNPINSAELECESRALELEVSLPLTMQGDESGAVGSGFYAFCTTIAWGEPGFQCLPVEETMDG